MSLLTNDTVIAVDIGTSAVRARVFTADGAGGSPVRIARSVSVGGDTFDAEALIDEVTAALAALDHSSPAAVAVSAQIGTVVLDRLGRPLVPSGGWSDARGVDALASVPAPILARCLSTAGRHAASAGALALALHLRDTPVARSIGVLLSPKDFLVHRLTGATGTDVIDAAYTLASDVRTRSWNVPLLEELGLDPSWFPPQYAATDVIGRLSADAAMATGIREGTPVIAGGPDGSVGLGLLLGVDRTRIADVAGTTDVVGRLLDDPDAVPSGASLNPSLLPDRWIAGGATGMTGGAVALWRDLVGDVPDGALTALPPGVDGLRVIPSMSGSRFPRWRSAARGGASGQTPNHRAAHFLRAAQEGAAFTVREGLDLLDPTRSLSVVLAGGAVRSPHIAQLRADVFDRAVEVWDDPDVTLLGAAALALVGSGLSDDLDTARTALMSGVRHIEPDRKRAEEYHAVYADWLHASDTPAGAAGCTA